MKSRKARVLAGTMREGISANNGIGVSAQSGSTRTRPA
ncbi:Uncharacterised protein [Bordetella pertussis]|nr:Uncharacterised protein [Bordetella pertussis]